MSETAPGFSEAWFTEELEERAVEDLGIEDSSGDSGGKNEILSVGLSLGM